MAVSWLVAPCSLVEVYQRFRDDRPDYGGSKYLWNVGKLLLDYTALQPRRHLSSNLSLVHNDPIVQLRWSNFFLPSGPRRVFLSDPRANKPLLAPLWKLIAKWSNYHIMCSNINFTEMYKNYYFVTYYFKFAPAKAFVWHNFYLENLHFTARH
jgi:hypothetical protein